jgi:hypothetical protein
MVAKKKQELDEVLIMCGLQEKSDNEYVLAFFKLLS